MIATAIIIIFHSQFRQSVHSHKAIIVFVHHLFNKRKTQTVIPKFIEMNKVFDLWSALSCVFHDTVLDFDTIVPSYRRGREKEKNVLLFKGIMNVAYDTQQLTLSTGNRYDNTIVQTVCFFTVSVHYNTSETKTIFVKRQNCSV